MTTADAQNRLTRLLDNCEDARQRFGRVRLPWMTLTAQDDVRRFEASNSFQRHVVEWLDEDFDPWNESAKNSPNFARACSLAVDGVVYEID